MLPPSAVLRLTRTPLYFSLSLSLSLSTDSGDTSRSGRRVCRPRLASAASTVGRRSLICLPLSSRLSHCSSASALRSSLSPVSTSRVALCITFTHTAAGRQAARREMRRQHQVQTHERSFILLSQSAQCPSLPLSLVPSTASTLLHLPHCPLLIPFSLTLTVSFSHIRKRHRRGGHI